MLGLRRLYLVDWNWRIGRRTVSQKMPDAVFTRSKRRIWGVLEVHSECFPGKKRKLYLSIPGGASSLNKSRDESKVQRCVLHVHECFKCAWFCMYTSMLVFYTFTYTCARSHGFYVGLSIRSFCTCIYLHVSRHLTLQAFVVSFIYNH